MKYSNNSAWRDFLSIAWFDAIGTRAQALSKSRSQ